MIKNQLQYKVSKSQLTKFEEAILTSEQRTEVPDGTHPIMWKAQIDALKSQAATLRRELKEYEELTSGQVSDIEIKSLQDFPIGLIKARIAKGLTQKDLASLCGVKPQQIQRWEDEEYYKAKFEQLIKVAQALEVSVTERISFEREAKSNLSILSKMGIGIDFIKRRLCPGSDDEPADMLSRSAEHLKRIWGIILRDDGSLNIDNMTFDGAQLARFKLPKNADSIRVKAYAQYAYTVADIVANADKSTPKKPSKDWEAVRDDASTSGVLNLESLLRYSWGLGIPVIPLSDPIRFHGCCWRISGRNVVILKQSNREESRWMFDLLHELFHAADTESSQNFSAMAESAADPSRRESEDEKLANEFAGNVLLNGMADEYYAEVLAKSSRKIQYIKRNVQLVAQKHRVNVGVLANYTAFRLKNEFDADWWGAASNLQDGEKDAYTVAQSVFAENFDLSSLDEVDRHIVKHAVSEPDL
jgi:transcriptional regulator with XRE-family HTH domain/Zn-dependent peptidase ImmA (M78 family)